MRASDRVKHARRIIGLAAGIIGSSLVSQAWADNLVYDVPLNGTLGYSGTGGSGTAGVIASSQGTTGTMGTTSGNPVNSQAYQETFTPNTYNHAPETTGQGLTIPASPSLNWGNGTSMTIVGWINPTDPTGSEWVYGSRGEQAFAAQQQVYGPGWTAYVDATGNIGMDFAGSDSNDYRRSFASVSPNQWSQVVIVVNSTTVGPPGFGNYTFYINGVNAGTQDTAGESSSLGPSITYYDSKAPNTTGPITIGASKGSNNPFAGSVADFGLFNSALTPTEVAAAYNVAEFSGLNYNIGQVDELYGLEQAGSGEVTINGKTWEYDPSVSGGGAVNSMGGGIYSVQLGASDGVETIATGGPAQWISSSSGDWNNANNWSASIPNAVGAEADFFGAISSNHTVYTDQPITVGTIDFNNANSYFITGSSTLTLQASTGNAQVIVQQGTQEINIPTIVASNTVFNVSAGANLIIANPLTIDPGMTLTQTGSGTVTYQSIINVESNAIVAFADNTHAHELNLASGSTATVSAPVLEVDQLSNLGTLNLQNNTVIINYGSGADPISAIAAEIKTGYAGGTWTGAGIMSTNAQSNSSYGIGYADAADPGNPAGLASGQIEVMYTLLGDANLDHKVNGSDFTLMAANFNDSVTNGWDKGDFNYSGTVNGDDFVLLAENFNQFASQSSVDAADLAALNAFAAANGISLTSVPEPASAGMLVVAGLGILRRRKRSAR